MFGEKPLVRALDCVHVVAWPEVAVIVIRVAVDRLFRLSFELYQTCELFLLAAVSRTAASFFFVFMSRNFQRA